MKKALLVIMMLLLVSGCTVKNTNILELVQVSLDDAISNDITSVVNNNQGYISYYLEPSVGIDSSNSTNTVLKYDSEYIIVNIDVPHIVAVKYYQTTNEFRDVDAFSNQVYSNQGEYLSASGIVRPYRYRLYELSDDEYGIFLQNSNILMFSRCAIGSVLNVTEMMMMVLRTIRVDEEKVVSAFSSKELINYNRETLDIFEKVYPESGNLEDLIEGE